MATWTVYATLWPAVNPSAGGPPYGNFTVIGPIGNFSAEVNANNVVNAMNSGSAGTNYMPIPWPTGGIYHGWVVQTSP